MRYVIFTFFIGVLVLIFGFREKNTVKIANDNEVVPNNFADEKRAENCGTEDAESQGSDFVQYAKTLIGTRYLYGSADPAQGLDCSGFINAVSTHVGIKVPRSSVEFTNLGTTIETDKAKPSDLILFTGTDPGKHIVGHIGIVTDNKNGEVEFIHSSSGKANGVTISDLAGYYETRFVKIIRIFPTAADEV